MRSFLTAIALVALAFTLFSCKEKQDTPKRVKKEVEVVKADFDKEELDEKFGTQETYIVKTFQQSPAVLSDDHAGNGLYIKTTHYQLSDGTWMTDEHSYKYKLIVTGRMKNAAMDSVFHILSNRESITFDEAVMAAGFSSNSEDYFKPEDAVIVAFE